jgi:hypothetical protein
MKRVVWRRDTEGQNFISDVLKIFFCENRTVRTEKRKTFIQNGFQAKLRAEFIRLTCGTWR